MKKYILFAAALLCLAACSNDDFDTSAPEQTITLKATVNFGNDDNQSLPNRVAPNTPISTENGSTINFHWQEGDKVLLVSGENSSTFTLKEGSISTDGKTAQFTGTALPDMSCYIAFYAGPNTTNEFLEDLTLPMTNADGNYNIIAISENGNADGFTLDTFNSTLRLRLKGDGVTLGKLEYCAGIDDPITASTTINFGTDGLALSATAQDVWVPRGGVNIGGFTLRFYDTAGTLIMKKNSTVNLNSYGDYGALISFPVLEVKGC